MKSIGRPFVLVLGASAGCVAIASLAALLEWWSLALIALGFALVPVLAALAVIRRDVLRLRTGGLTAASATAPAFPLEAADSLAREARLAQRLATEVAKVGVATSAQAQRTADETTNALTAQVSALLWLNTAHQPPGAPPLDLVGAMPQQFATLLRQVAATTPRRVLAVGLGDAGLWLAHGVARHGGSTDLVTSDDHEAQRLLTNQAAMSADKTTVSVVDVRVPDAPHAYLDWLDLSSLDGAYDLIVVAVGHQEAVRPALPVLPLFEGLLATGGMVTTLEHDDAMPVATAWAANVKWEAPEGLPIGFLRRSA